MLLIVIITNNNYEWTCQVLLFLMFIPDFSKVNTGNLLDKGNDRPCIHQAEPL